MNETYEAKKTAGDKMGLFGLSAVAVLTTRFITPGTPSCRTLCNMSGAPKRKKSVWEPLDKRLES